MGLFKCDIDNIRWGVTEGGHVAHIIDGRNESEKEIVPGYTGDFKKVSQSEAYDNKGDGKTKDFFIALAYKAESDYNSEGAEKQFKGVLEGIRDYVTSSGRSGRQKCIASLRIKMLDYRQTLEKRVKASARSGKDAALDNARMKVLDSYASMLQKQFGGDLAVPKGIENSDGYIKASNPADAYFGKAGRWVKTDDELFPHDPSPNDIKQGRINDCYMMSALIGMAAKDPQKIRDSIRDNNDGTVTVRFFDVDERTKAKRPVYINVEKSVNKVGTANSYSSSSLWVQMVEKAYVGFMNAKCLNNKGFANIDFGTSDKFINAFDEKAAYTSASHAFGYSNISWNDPKYGETPSSINNADPYSERDDALYGFLKEKAGKEIVTVGTSPINDPEKEKYLLGIGIRTGHAYAVNKVFEKEVNGITKKFVQLRDPFATFRAKYDDNGKLVDDSTLIGATLHAGNSNMGTFNLELTDFQRTFNSFSGISADSLNAFKEKFAEISKKENEAKKANEPIKEEKKTEEILSDENDNSAADDFEIMESGEKKTDSFDEPGSDDFVDIEDIAPAAEKDTTPYSVAIGFGRQSALLFDAKRRVFGFERNSDEMKNVKSKLERLGEVNGGSIDDVKKAVEELKKAADAYTTSGKKAHNKRFDAVKAIGELASKELESIRKIKDEKKASAEAEAEKTSPEEEAARLSSMLKEKGHAVPENFTEKLASLKSDADEAAARMDSDRKNGNRVSTDDLKRYALYDQIKKSIENGSFSKKEFDRLISESNVPDVKDVSKVIDAENDVFEKTDEKEFVK